MKALMLVICLLMTTSLFAEASEGKWKKRREEFEKALNLSPEQIEKLKANKKENREELKTLKTQFKESKNAFKEAMQNPQVSQDELKSKFEAYVSSRDKFQRKRFELMLQKRSILTPEQIAKFKEMKKDFKGKKRK